MNLEEEIANNLSKELASAIDFEILADVLCRFGWNYVELERFANNKHAVDVVTWVQENCKGNWQRNGCKFIFEETGDAVMFTLRWKC